MKKRFGKLGFYLIDQAQVEIKEIKRHALFQKAEIRKKYMERVNENSLRIRKNFIENYNQYLNNALSSTFIELKENILNLKNRLVDELRTSVCTIIKEKIHNNYSNYINFLLDIIKKHHHFIDKPPKVFILFNSREYDFFNKNPKKLSNILKNSVEIKQFPDDFIGGFKITRSEGKISYDYSIDNLIEKNSTFIQSEFSKIIAEFEIKDNKNKFEEFIQNQKMGIDIYLKDYD